MQLICKNKQLRKKTAKAINQWRKKTYNEKLFDQYTINVYAKLPVYMYFPKFLKKTKLSFPPSGFLEDTNDYNVYNIYINLKKCIQNKDLLQVLLHELGHMLGLYHPEHNKKCIMQTKSKYQSKNITQLDIKYNLKFFPKTDQLLDLDYDLSIYKNKKIKYKFITQKNYLPEVIVKMEHKKNHTLTYHINYLSDFFDLIQKYKSRHEFINIQQTLP